MNVPAYTTMTQAIEGLRDRGFITNFEFLDNAFQAVGTGKTFQAGDLTIVEHHRFEGTSDPDDMSVVYAIESKDGTRGIVTDAFGTYANPNLGAFLRNVRVHESV